MTAARRVFGFFILFSQQKSADQNVTYLICS
jgi:hypothetical protein